MNCDSWWWSGGGEEGGWEPSGGDQETEEGSGDVRARVRDQTCCCCKSELCTCKHKRLFIVEPYYFLHMPVLVWEFQIGLKGVLSYGILKVKKTNKYC